MHLQKNMHLFVFYLFFLTKVKVSFFRQEPYTHIPFPNYSTKYRMFQEASQLHLIPGKQFCRYFPLYSFRIPTITRLGIFPQLLISMSAKVLIYLGHVIASST